jgi:hypothetical protein
MNGLVFGMLLDMRVEIQSKKSSSLDILEAQASSRQMKYTFEIS